MFIKVTEHFKGPFPLDAGGVVFGGYGRKEVSDKQGAAIVKADFPYIAECNADGDYLLPIPPVKVIVFEEPEPEKVSLPEPGAVTEQAVADGVQGEDDIQQPDIEDAGTAEPAKADGAGKKAGSKKGK